MSVRVNRRIAQRKKLLDAIAAKAGELCESRDIAFDPAQFIELYYAQAETEDLARDAGALAAAALGHLRFAAQRRPIPEPPRRSPASSGSATA